MNWRDLLRASGWTAGDDTFDAVELIAEELENDFPSTHGRLPSGPDEVWLWAEAERIFEAMQV